MSQSFNFVAWQPVLTDHQAFTFQELAKQAGVPVIAYVTALEDPTRRIQGWADTQVSTVERRLVPKRGAWRYCYRHLLEHRQDVHIFCSAFQEPLMMVCLLLAVWLRVKFYLVSEPYSPVAQSYFSDRPGVADRLKAVARPLIYKLYAIVLKRRTQGIFAISVLALKQYGSAGIAPEKLFPFGYFVPSLNQRSDAVMSASEQPALRLVFVGSLIARKGLDLLIAAVRRASTTRLRISLDVFGPGDPGAFGFDGEHVRYCGQIPFGKTQQAVASYDLLVLPSRYDGWGVVVNEALCAGVPVVCSDHVGASVVIKKFAAGAMFASNDTHALTALLVALASDRHRLQAMREATVKAAAAIQPAVAAKYMVSVFRAPQGDKVLIPSPWYPD